MVLLRVYSEPLLRDYYSTLCSRATLFIVIVYGLILVPPVFIAYATNDLWRSVNSYREQPDVLYLNQCILLVDQEGGWTIAWSSLPDYLPPPFTEGLTVPPNISFSEEDTDSDGKNDALDFSVDLTSLPNITTVQLLLFFTVQLSRYSSVNMQSLAYISHSGSSAVSSVWVGGDFVLNQREPLPASGRAHNYGPVVNMSSQSWQEYQLSHILQNYHQRKLTTTLHPVYTVWQQNGTDGDFALQAEINYTEQTLLYRPSFWERLKWAWIQYLAIVIVFWFCLRHVQSFVFRNHIVPTFKPFSD